MKKIRGMKRKLKGKDVPKRKGIQDDRKSPFCLAQTVMSNALFLRLLGPPAVSDSHIPKSLGCNKKNM